MDWILRSFGWPDRTDIYQVSAISDKKPPFKSYVVAIAHFDKESQEWCQWDAFRSAKGDVIDGDKIIAWQELPPVHIGVVE